MKRFNPFNRIPGDQSTGSSILALTIQTTGWRLIDLIYLSFPGIKKTAHKSLFSLAMVLFLFTTVTAQITTCPDQNKCNASDVKVMGAYLGDINGQPLPLVCGGGTVNAYLYFVITSNASREGVVLAGTVTVDGGTPQVLPGVCFPQSIKGSNKNIVKYPTPITWTCGQPVRLSNVFMAWTNGSTNLCSAIPSSCDGYSPKCYTQPPLEYYQVDISPVGSNFTWSTGSCPTGNKTLTFTSQASGGTPPYTYEWDFGDGSAVSTATNPAHTYANLGTYQVTLVVTDNTNPVHKTGSFTKSVAVTASCCISPTAAASVTSNATDNTICAGTSTTLMVNGGSVGTNGNWKWYTEGCGLGISIGSGSSILVNPATTTTYYVRAEADCGSTTCASITITVNQLPPAPVLSVVNNCNGTSTISAKDGSDVLVPEAQLTWSNGNTGNPIIVNTTASVTATRTKSGCTSVTSNSVTPVPKTAPAAPILSVTNNCTGTATITAKDGADLLIPSGELTWSNGASGNPISVSSTSSVTATRTLGGCTSVASNSVTPAPGTTPPPPVLTVVDNCDGTSTITAKDGMSQLIAAGELTWSNGATGNPISVNNTDAVTATRANGVCVSGNSNTVNPAPKTAPAAPILSVINNCDGTATISAKDAMDGLLSSASLTWSNGGSGNPITVNNTASVTATTTSNSCPSMASNAVNPAPKLTPGAPVLSVLDNCNGTSTITARDASDALVPGDQLTWSNGGNGNPIDVTSTDAVTATRTIDGCISTASNSVSPLPGSALPAPILSVVNNCDGTSTITAKDGMSVLIPGGELTWSNAATGNPITVNNTTAVTATRSIAGCESTASNSVTPAPKTTPAAPILSVVNNCDGTSTISAKDGMSVLIPGGELTWSNAATGNPITVNNTTAVTATRTIAGCESAASNSVTPAPKATPAAPILSVVNNCDGTSTITAKDGMSVLIPGGELTWSNVATGNPITVNNTTAVTATRSIAGCESAASNSVTPAPKTTPAAPILSVVNNCDGTSTISAKDGMSVLIPGGELTWSNAATGNPITVNNTTAVTATRTIAGCESAASNSVTPAPKTTPAAPILSVVNNCDGTSTITAKDGMSVLIPGGELTWSNAATGNPITVNNTTAVTATRSIAGCESAASNSVTPAPKTTPAAPILSVVNNCDGTSTITAKDGMSVLIPGGELTWSNAATGNPITVNNTTAVTVTRSIAGCESAASNSVTPAPKTTPAAPILSVVNNCDGTSTITAKDGMSVLIPGGELTWSNAATGNPITVNNTTAVTATRSIAGCESAASNSVTPAPKTTPAAPILSVVNNCDGTSTITAKDGMSVLIPGGELTWSNAATGNPITVNNTTAVTATRSIAGCESAASNSVTPAPKTTPAAPILSVVDNCNGTSTITAKDGMSVLIPGGELTWSNAATGNPITVNNTTAVTATRSIAGCESATSNSVTPAPKTTPAAPTLSVVNNCDGTSTITAKDGMSVLIPGGELTWSNAATGNPITVNNTTAVTATRSIAGCESATSNSVTPAPKTTPAAPILSVVDNCNGTSTITAKDGMSVLIPGGELTWSNAATGNPITVNNTTAVTATRSIAGCESATSNSVTPAPKTTPAAPILSVVDNCNGTSTITAKDGMSQLIAAGELTWSNAATGNPITVNNTTAVTATRTINGCTSVASNSVTPAPKIAPAAPVLAVVNNCDGTSTISAKDAMGVLVPSTELTWSNAATGNPISVSTTTPVTATRTTNACESAVSNSVTPAPKTTSSAPAVNSPICAGATSVSGTSSEANGTVIEVFKGVASLGTALVNSGTWNKTVSALSAGDVITAKATASGKCISIASPGVTVSANSAAPVVVSQICAGATSVSGSSSEANGTVIEVFKAAVSLGATTVSGGTWSKTVPALSAGDVITAKATATGKCTSASSGSVTVSANTAAPVLTAQICAGATTVTGTSTEANGTVIEVYKGAISLGTTTVSAGVWSKSVAALSAGDVITAKATATGKCTSVSTSSVTVSANSAAPVITAPICAGSTTVAGTSTEANGSSIELFNGIVSLGTTTVNAGAWMKTVAALNAGDVITAKATGIGKCTSVASAAVTVAPNLFCAKYNGDYFANTESTTTGGTAIVTLVYNITGVTNGCNNINSLSVNDFTVNYIADPAGTGVTMVPLSKMYSNGVFTIKYSIALQNTAYSATVQFSLASSNSNFRISEDCSDNPVLLTVSTKSDGFVTGGGFIIPTNSGGDIGGAVVNGLKNNFGFNLKFNKNGKLQGNWNTIIRRRENGQEVVYQVKSNVAASLVVTKISATSYRADMSFTSANFQNLTCTLCPVGANNGTVLVSVYDNGEPGSGIDRILITIKDRNGVVWYTSDAAANHSITYTNLALLNAGNIQIHITSPGQKAAETLVTAATETTLTATALPNPTNTSFNINVRTNNSKDKMDLMVTDMTGRTVQLVGNIHDGQLIRLGAHYKPGMYLVTLTQDGKKYQLKLVKY